MKLSIRTKAMITSYFRVFLAAGLAAYLQTGKAPLELGVEDLTALANAGIAALVLTGVNYLRSGETRFGVGSEDVGMGGADSLGKDGKIVVTPVDAPFTDYKG